MLDSVEFQSFRDFNVLISTQSSPSLIDLPSYSFDLTIIDNSSLGGFIPDNFNALLDNASGSWIKIMFADDYFISCSDLSNIVQAISFGQSSWYVTCSLNKYSPLSLYTALIKPFFSRFLLDINTIGSPSSLVLCNSDQLPRMDLNSWMLLDCDYYLSLYNIFGLPSVIDNVFVVNEIHVGQFSSLRRSKDHRVINKLKSEYEYLLSKNSYKTLPSLLKFLFKLYVFMRRKFDLFIYFFIHRPSFPEAR